MQGGKPGHGAALGPCQGREHWGLWSKAGGEGRWACGEALRRARLQASAPFPCRCSPRLLPPGSERQAQRQHAALAISRSHRCGAGGCRHPQQPLRPRFANVPAWPLLTATASDGHRATATLQCFPGRARGISSPSNAAALPHKLQHCSQAGDSLCTGRQAASLIQTPPSKYLREKTQQKQNISLLGEDYQKLGMRPRFVASSKNPPDGPLFHRGLHCASCPHQWIKLLAGGWEVKEGILYFSSCDL